MRSREKHLKKRVRETLSRLSHEELVKILKESPLDYTPFALQVAREELSKRKRIASLHKDLQALRQTDEDAPEGDPVRSKSNGCYIEVWRDRDYEGDHLLIEGPAEYEALKSASADWGDDIGSLRVGPHAFVLAYEDKNFKGSMISFGPCQEIADLKDFKFDDQIDSIKIINSIKIIDDTRYRVKEGSEK